MNDCHKFKLTHETKIEEWWLGPKSPNYVSITKGIIIPKCCTTSNSNLTCENVNISTNVQGLLPTIRPIMEFFKKLQKTTKGFEFGMYKNFNINSMKVYNEHMHRSRLIIMTQGIKEI